MGTMLLKPFFPHCFLGVQTSGKQCFFAMHSMKHFNVNKHVCSCFPRYFSTKCLGMHKLGNIEGNYVSAIMFPCLPVGGLKCPRIFCCLCSLHPSVLYMCYVVFISKKCALEIPDKSQRRKAVHCF